MEPLPIGAVLLMWFGTVLSGALGLLADTWLPDIVALIIFYTLYVGNIFVSPVIHRAIIKGRRVYGKPSRNL